MPVARLPGRMTVNENDARVRCSLEDDGMQHGP